MPNKLYYLASPYSHPDANVQELRFQQVCEVAARLLEKGIYVFSPIAHTHPIAAYGLPKDFKFWKQYDELIFSRCDALIVLMLDGWVDSVGVKAEIEMATKQGKEIYYMNPATLRVIHETKGRKKNV